MNEVAAAKGIELHIEAHPVGSIDQYGDSADVILLGPQVRYELKNVKGKYSGKPVEIINMQDYGMMNGEAVYKKAKAMMVISRTDVCIWYLTMKQAFV